MQLRRCRGYFTFAGLNRNLKRPSTSFIHNLTLAMLTQYFSCRFANILSAWQKIKRACDISQSEITRLQFPSRWERISPPQCDSNRLLFFSQYCPIVAGETYIMYCNRTPTIIILTSYARDFFSIFLVSEREDLVTCLSCHRQSP